MITLDHISCAFRQRNVLSNINLQIEEGSFYAIMGANGCGKTTLLRCIGGLLPPQQGHVMVHGK